MEQNEIEKNKKIYNKNKSKIYFNEYAGSIRGLQVEPYISSKIIQLA
jgi:hypothetical protein